MGALVAFEKIVPVALAFGGGVMFARRGVIDATSSKAFADFAFLFAVPCYLFGNIYHSDLDALFQWRALTSYAATAFAGAAMVAMVAWLTSTRDPRHIALRIMAGIQVNTAYFAVPVFVMIFGTAAPIFPVLLFQVCVLTLVVLTVMELGGPQSERVPAAGPLPVPVGTGDCETDRNSTLTVPPAPRRSIGGKVARAMGGSLATPVVLACNGGVVLNLLAIDLPDPILGGLGFVGEAASPVALFALGLYLGRAGLNLRGTTAEEIWLIAVKCLVFPMAVWLVGKYAFGIHGEWLDYLVIIAAMPAPQNVFIFAQRYSVGVDMSAALVAKSSVVALLTLPFWTHWAQTT